MTENPHENEDLERRREKPCEKEPDAEEPGAWSEDQKRRGYYYDDACGYETYEPDADEQEEN